jgi:hypothetical protein
VGGAGKDLLRPRPEAVLFPGAKFVEITQVTPTVGLDHAHLCRGKDGRPFDIRLSIPDRQRALPRHRHGVEIEQFPPKRRNDLQQQVGGSYRLDELPLPRVLFPYQGCARLPRTTGAGIPVGMLGVEAS